MVWISTVWLCCPYFDRLGTICLRLTWYTYLQCRFLVSRQGLIHQTFCGWGYRADNWTAFPTLKFKVKRVIIYFFPFVFWPWASPCFPWASVSSLVKWGWVSNFQLKNWLYFIFKPNDLTAACQLAFFHVILYLYMLMLTRWYRKCHRIYNLMCRYS